MTMHIPKTLALAAVLVLLGAGCTATAPDIRIEVEGGLNTETDASGAAGTSPAGADAGLDTSLDVEAGMESDGLDAEGSASIDGEATVDDGAMEEDPDGTGDDAPVANHVITFDGSAYSDMNLTIDAGDTVTWRNGGASNIWPASNVHPTHQLLPEFDANRPVAPGDSYSFTFTKPGAWTWHDHLRVNQTGTITVR